MDVKRIRVHRLLQPHSVAADGDLRARRRAEREMGMLRPMETALGFSLRVSPIVAAPKRVRRTRLSSTTMSRVADVATRADGNSDSVRCGGRRAVTCQV